jgi:hypothetical protein
MSETDTPRTDEQVNGKPCTRFAIMAGDSLRDAMVPSEFARQLERELAEAREIVEMQKETMRQMREKYGLGKRNVMRELKQQRDTLAEAIEFALSNALASGESENALRKARAAVQGGEP